MYRFITHSLHQGSLKNVCYIRWFVVQLLLRLKVERFFPSDKIDLDLCQLCMHITQTWLMLISGQNIVRFGRYYILINMCPRLISKNRNTVSSHEILILSICNASGRVVKLVLCTYYYYYYFIYLNSLLLLLLRHISKQPILLLLLETLRKPITITIN